MREAAALANGHAYHADRPVERAAAAAVALYPTPSTSNDSDDDGAVHGRCVAACRQARVLWAGEGGLCRLPAPPTSLKLWLLLPQEHQEWRRQCIPPSAA